jgi:hypothetical protein
MRARRPLGLVRATAALSLRVAYFPVGMLPGLPMKTLQP